MNNDLYQTIEELKDTLENIDSARKQVSDTVAAFTATRNGIQEYVDTLCGIENILNRLVALLQNNKVIIDQQASSAITNLQTSCSEITARIQNEQESMSRAFSEKLGSKIQEIDRQVRALDNSVKRMESCCESAIALNDEIIDKLTIIQNNLGLLKNSNENITQILINNQHTIQKSLDYLNNEISESKAKTEKLARINRNIGIATLALLLLLLVLHFTA